LLQGRFRADATDAEGGGLIAIRIRFDGQVALVTGAGRGLGRAYADLLARRGAHVVVHDAGVAPDGTGNDPSVAERAVDEIRQRGGRADPAFEDLAVRGSAASLVTTTVERFGRLDVVVHNAGIAIRSTLSDLDDASLDRAVQVNGRAAVELLRAALPHMAERGYGRIVLTVSGHGLYPDASGYLVAYSVSKQMQFGLMNALSTDAAERGVLINAISPVAATRMLTRQVSPGSLAPEDVAPAVAFLASDACHFSGVVVRAADGKFSIGRYAVTSGIDMSGSRPIEPEALADAWAEVGGGSLAPP
jgi:NAD(P)-dependent dehydrogenase (short-subunit alcohol dehydrogenase family)